MKIGGGGGESVRELERRKQYVRRDKDVINLTRILSVDGGKMSDWSCQAKPVAPVFISDEERRLMKCKLEPIVGEDD